MKELKYIIIDNLGLEVPVVFSHLLSHADVARGKIVVSAGFCSISRTDYTFVCWGKSVSLEKGSRGITDECILDEFFNLPL